MVLPILFTTKTFFSSNPTSPELKGPDLANMRSGETENDVQIMLQFQLLIFN